MAKSATRKPARPAKKSSAKAKAKTGATRKRSSPKPKAKSKSKAKSEPQMGTAEAIAGLLETPLVAEVIAAGAAAALSTLTQQALSKRAKGGTAVALKLAVAAAATAMGSRLATEFDEIVKGGKEAKRGAK